MSRKPRIESESGMYHVFARGVGRQLIFEDDADRVFLKRQIGKLADRFDVSILAWAFMGNHLHFLLNADMGAISKFMQRMQTSYACHFNVKYDHVGHLFQGRFGSQPIRDEAQLLMAVRYIHLNPVQGGLSATPDYKWSSYPEYLGVPDLCDTSLVWSAFGDKETFLDFHEKPSEERFIDVEGVECRYAQISEDQISRVAESELGDGWQERLRKADRGARDSSLRALKRRGLSIRQIERLTGIGRGIIQRS